ncbi:glycoside hydrolase family 73 protein [Paenibacillus alginolyticus]|uniref:Glucosaminidase domain-containing protein n=1 Tax=Paenibacillus alginolyticus TaxID=59839 RepID=A0ABT4GAV6_9BACL|nr:glucosaminidase domain-containing protein [Paenibacillus alginolyticus]MCY9693282.1 glucosaminidase domain-containing protein [Paenibacillus alginolyticus]MEC0145056.1 glucosaminidase domain-containing protein [Paenibacillus alginolyticus]
MATRQEFIEMIAPIAVKLRIENSPIYPSVRIAQAIQETGGNLNTWNNLVGYKVGNGVLTPFWQGDRVSTTTWEVIEGISYDNVPGDFRAYSTIEAGFRDQDLLFGAPRYASVRSARSPGEQAKALQSSGYATDPSYASKLNMIIQTYGLTHYDEEVARMLEKLQEQIVELQNRVSSLEEQAAMEVVPQWAKAAVDAAVQASLIDIPEKGSYDFYRLLTVLHRKGII